MFLLKSPNWYRINLGDTTFIQNKHLHMDQLGSIQHFENYFEFVDIPCLLELDSGSIAAFPAYFCILNKCIQMYKSPQV